jgi:uncharacterized protein YjeT (DUF2065 family)
MGETKRLSKRERQEIRIAQAKKKKRNKNLKVWAGFIVVIGALIYYFIAF